jgi:hypothetical protein
MNNLTPTNWQEVQVDLIATFNGKACNSEFTKLQNATTFQQLFRVVFDNYEWLKDRDYKVAEIENITPIQKSTFMVWLLKTYCLGKDVDIVVQAVIDLHKQVMIVNEVTEEQWAAARAAARYATSAASDAAWDAAWYAASDASDAAWDAAWEQITTKLIGIIYE